MKKTAIVVIFMVFAFAMVLVSIPKNVQAGYSATKQPIASGNWSAGTEIEVDLSAAPAPEWLQLMTTEAVVVKGPTKICHELGGGKFHWVGEIRQLKGDKWIKIETINDWATDEEGAFMSCAQAPSAGTYALFAYYNGPQEFFNATEAPMPTCSVNEVYVGGFCVCKDGYEKTNGDTCTFKNIKPF